MLYVFSGVFHHLHLYFVSKAACLKQTLPRR